MIFGNNQLRKKTLGFSMMELIIAIFILSVGVIAVLTMFPLSMGLQETAELSTLASEAGQQKIEELASQSYEDIAIGVVTENQLTSPFGGLQRETKITYVDPSQGFQEVGTDQGVKKIEVTVSWRSVIGVGSRNIKITTLIAKR